MHRESVLRVPLENGGSLPKFTTAGPWIIIDGHTHYLNPDGKRIPSTACRCASWYDPACPVAEHALLGKATSKYWLTSQRAMLKTRR